MTDRKKAEEFEESLHSAGCSFCDKLHYASDVIAAHLAGQEAGEKAGYLRGLIEAQNYFLGNDGDEAAILIGKRIEELLAKEAEHEEG